VKKYLVMFALLLAPVAAAAQVPQPQRERREELEAQIVQRFLSNTATQLQLDNESRNRLEQHLRDSAPRRRALAQSTVQLRGQMLRAVRDESTTDAEFSRLISEMTRLRDQEEALWKSDQEALSRILTPRQHARFVIMWLRFNDQVRDMAMRRPQGPPGRPQSGIRQPIRR
jgi:Spy/CpxP family protein refolding chaperone